MTLDYRKSSYKTDQFNGSCVHLIHTYYDHENNKLIPNVAIVGLNKDRGYYESPGGRPESGESPEETAAREMLEELSLKKNMKNIKFVASKLTYIGSCKNLNGNFTPQFALNLIGYSTSDKKYTEHYEFRHVPIKNMDKIKPEDVHGEKLSTFIKGMNIRAIKIASEMSLNKIYASELM